MGFRRQALVGDSTCSGVFRAFHRGTIDCEVFRARVRMFGAGEDWRRQRAGLARACVFRIAAGTVIITGVR